MFHAPKLICLAALISCSFTLGVPAAEIEADMERLSREGVTIDLKKVDTDNPTQFGRAMEQLGVEMIPGYSPQARGRGERPGPGPR